MKANELRLGNYVFLKSKLKPYEISSGHDIEEIDDAPENFDAEPIPLTEEWLLKFGFEIDGVWAHKTKKISPKKLLGYMNGGNIFICQIGEHIRFQEVFLCNCQYVHQLQNLYFALTSEELEILNIKTKN